jgi:hypothetical protein
MAVQWLISLTRNYTFLISLLNAFNFACYINFLRAGLIHCIKNDNCCNMGCNAVGSGRFLPMFRNNLPINMDTWPKFKAMSDKVRF